MTKNNATVSNINTPGTKERLSVLVMEDNATICNFLINYLRSGQYQVSTAVDVEQAMDALQHHKFDIVMVDLKNSKKLKAAACQPGIKIITIPACPADDKLKEVSVDYLTSLCALLEPADTLDEARKQTQTKASKQAAGEIVTEDKQKKEITSMMEESWVLYPSPEFVKEAGIKSMGCYNALYQWSIRDPEGFWGHLAEQLDWYKKWDKFMEYDFTDKPFIKYFIGGKINLSYNCLDRHLDSWRKNKAAIIWQGEGEDEVKTYTYQQLHY